jgi:hypothetical protein
MGMRLGDELARRFVLAPEERELLALGPADMDRRQRKLYHRSIEPRLEEFRAFLRDRLARSGPEAAREWATATAFAVMARGHASVLDQLVIDVVGRRRVSAIISAARGGPAS